MVGGAEDISSRHRHQDDACLKAAGLKILSLVNFNFPTPQLFKPYNANFRLDRECHWVYFIKALTWFCRAKSPLKKGLFFTLVSKGRFVRNRIPSAQQQAFNPAAKSEKYQ
jgi:hypothetical protein